MNKLILSILICFILLVPTKSYSISGNDWLRICKNGDLYAVAKISCVVWISGLRDMGDYRSDFNEHIHKKFEEQLSDSVDKNMLDFIRDTSRLENYCIPNKVTNEQLGKILMKWLDGNPEVLHAQLSHSFTRSMQKTFPCDYSK